MFQQKKKPGLDWNKSCLNDIIIVKMTCWKFAVFIYYKDM